MYFLRGIAYGLGFLTGFAIIIPILIAFLRSIEWVPLVGGFVTDIVLQIEEAQRFAQPR
jgi:hypothetical protein